MDLSIDTMHTKDPFVLFGSEGSAISLPLNLLSSRIIARCHCSHNNDNIPLFWYNFMTLNDHKGTE